MGPPRARSAAGCGHPGAAGAGAGGALDGPRLGGQRTARATSVRGTRLRGGGARGPGARSGSTARSPAPPPLPPRTARPARGRGRGRRRGQGRWLGFPGTGAAPAPPPPEGARGPQVTGVRERQHPLDGYLPRPRKARWLSSGKAGTLPQDKSHRAPTPVPAAVSTSHCTEELALVSDPWCWPAPLWESKAPRSPLRRKPLKGAPRAAPSQFAVSHPYSREPDSASCVRKSRPPIRPSRSPSKQLRVTVLPPTAVTAAHNSPTARGLWGPRSRPRSTFQKANEASSQKANLEN